MYNPNNNPYGGWGRGPYPQQQQQQGGYNNFGTRYQFQTAPYAGPLQSSDLISKVMGLLAFSFVFASAGAWVGMYVLHLTFMTYLIVAILGLVLLIALQAMIQRYPANLILLYAFTFLEGLSLSPLLASYVAFAPTILLQAFLITAATSIGLSIYAWTTKRDFTRLGDFLFVGLILLLIAGIVNIFFHSTIFSLIISIVGIGIFMGYILFDIQKAKYMANTLPNAIGLTVSMFLNVLNLFLYILRLLTILQGSDRD
ncbi:modulator of FtsH protease [Thermosporothrix hazakensis]|jgi:modulator of FtsH protease|uniref:Modulator of FtsH protease n=2 Tax=Thermosporothrix TaxID=768650 RepID=A0A326UCW2_THEHA|nr:Bax inhibitor-1/YccA family protein [Thermosporothrix hazakensis]PZW36298.1 modulator of FtsH protease [Thermosporothrix hazakensis]BBH88764.1 BAX inhibitor protein [Thermosporothrix sp. COM3]GCE46948.1 BAX inhibitor protein [Thermosporothrix hazakensis]